jgi:endonuclease YncB( thermonuclease family)
MTKISLPFCLMMVLACSTSARAEYIARVITVHEGDRLTIYHDGRTETIRLQGIDCPELKQPYGKKAKQVMEAYVGAREVVVRSVQRDRQGSVLAEVLLMDGRSVALELVKEGLAWSRGGLNKGQNLADEEELARAAGKGLWADPDPVPPWKWKAPKKAARKFSN